MPNIIRTGGGTVDQKVYIYNTGDEYTALTGGLVAGDTKGSGIRSKETDRFICQVTDAGQYVRYGYVTASQINFTNYTRLYVEWKQTHTGSNKTNGAGKIKIVTPQIDSTSVSANANGVAFIDHIAGTTDATNIIASVDVASINGSYWLSCIFASGDFNAQGKIEVYKIWLE